MMSAMAIPIATVVIIVVVIVIMFIINIKPTVKNSIDWLPFVVVCVSHDVADDFQRICISL